MREVHQIAREIERDMLAQLSRRKGHAAPNWWPFSQPYLKAMKTMRSVTEDYGADSGRSVILYFLSNVTTWRGENAKRLKAELKDLLGRAHGRAA